jgi:hypothetical protein
MSSWTDASGSSKACSSAHWGTLGVVRKAWKMWGKIACALVSGDTSRVFVKPAIQSLDVPHFGVPVDGAPGDLRVP